MIAITFSPSTLHLNSIKNRLDPLGIPTYFYLPDSSVLEPFLVIGTNSSNTDKTAQTGLLIEDTTVSIDIFLPNDSRTNAEEIKSKAIRLLGRNRLTASVLMDNSIGREVYHISITLTETIL